MKAGSGCKNEETSTFYKNRYSERDAELRHQDTFLQFFKAVQDDVDLIVRRISNRFQWSDLSTTIVPFRFCARHCTRIDHGETSPVCSNRALRAASSSRIMSCPTS